MYTNIDQFINKRDDVSMVVAQDEPDLFLLTEVIPKAQVNPIPPAVLSIPGYQLYLNFDPSGCNLGSRGQRGIAIFSKTSIKVTQVYFPTFQNIEQLWLEIATQSSELLLVGCIYRSPSAHGPASTSNLVELLRACSASKYGHIMIAGDVNFPQIDWTDGFSHAPDGHHSRLFIEGVQEFGFTQHVTKETRYREGVRPSVLDIILSSEEGLVQNLTYQPPIGSSDHVVLVFDLAC